MKEYMHMREDEKRLPVYPVGEKLIKIGSRTLIAVQQETRNGEPFVVVPGYVIKYRHRTESTPYGTNVYSEVEQIEEREKKNIEDVLRSNGLKGPISFW
jgi:hypothetical protein